MLRRVGGENAEKKGRVRGVLAKCERSNIKFMDEVK